MYLNYNIFLLQENMGCNVREAWLVRHNNSNEGGRGCERVNYDGQIT